MPILKPGTTTIINIFDKDHKLPRISRIRAENTGNFQKDDHFVDEDKLLKFCAITMLPFQINNGLNEMKTYRVVWKGFNNHLILLEVYKRSNG